MVYQWHVGAVLALHPVILISLAQLEDRPEEKMTDAQLSQLMEKMCPGSPGLPRGRHRYRILNEPPEFGYSHRPNEKTAMNILNEHQ